MFRAPLCPSSGAQEYYTVVAACGISCCGFVSGLQDAIRTYLINVNYHKIKKRPNRIRFYVEIKCQLDATEVFIADLIACSTFFGHHYAHHKELKSIIQWLLPVVFRAVVFSSCWSGVELRVMCPVCRMLQHPANRTHNPQLENQSMKEHRQQPLYNTLELLIMGIVVPETC